MDANHDLEAARPLTDEDCGFCGLHFVLHPRYKTIDALNKAQGRYADAHEWVHRGTVAAIRADERRASEERVECARCQSQPCRCPAGALSWFDHALVLEGALTDAEERERVLLSEKDGAYSERNKTVIALAWMAIRAGCRVGVREHEGEWDDDWRAILMIDLPTGQASWHFHDSERPMLAGFTPYHGEWDGHTTDEKYERLRALLIPENAASSEGEDA